MIKASWLWSSLPLVLTQSEGLRAADYTSGSAVDSAEDFLDWGYLEAVYSLTLYSIVFVSPTPPDFFFFFFFLFFKSPAASF